jgi:hypothetical protein
MVVAESFVEIATDPAHIIAELIFTFTIDFLIIALLWGVVFKKVVLPRLTKKIHEEIDIEHGYNHDEPMVVPAYSNFKPQELRYIMKAKTSGEIKDAS